MKLERVNEYVVPITVLVVGLTLSFYAGSAIGRGSFGLVATIMLGFFALSALLVLREKIWICIPVLWPLTGKLGALPLPFSVREVVVLIVFGSFLVLKALKIVRRKPVLGPVDFWMFVALTYLVTVFARNPVGVEALGSDRVGGRPYWEVIIGLAAYWVISRSAATPRQAVLLPILCVVGTSIDALLNWIAKHFPQTAPVLAAFYSGVEVEGESIATTAYIDTDASTQREAYLGGIGQAMLLAGSSYWRPLSMCNPFGFLAKVLEGATPVTVLLYWFRSILLFSGVYFVLVSGFRSSAMSCAFFFFVSSYIRRGWVDVIRIGVFLIPALALLLSMQGLLFELPLRMQRTLSFLPAHWSEVAVSDAQGSTEWRMEMWKQMLGSDKYISNRWLGDGFGFTKAQYAIIEANTNNPVAQGVEVQQENFMIMGEVHSGPVSAIRYVGILGLLIHIRLLIALAREAWRLIHRAKRGPYFILSLFLGLPMIWEPFNFLFVFGGYETSLPQAIYWAGLLKLLGNSMQPEPVAKAVGERIAKPRVLRPMPTALAPSARRRPA